MRKLAASLSLGLALVAAPGASHASDHGAPYDGPFVYALVTVFLLGATAAVVTPYAYAGVQSADGQPLGTSAATAFTLMGGVFGALSTRALVTLRRAPPSTDGGEFWGALAPPFLGAAGLGLGGYGPRPRDPWVGATSMLTAVTATHAVLAWVGRGDRPTSLVVGSVFGGVNAAGAAALALSADTELEAALLWTSAGLSLAGAASLAVTRATQRPLPQPPGDGERTPATVAWSAAPLGRGAGVFVSGTF